MAKAKKIRMLHNYGGKITGERRILPGVYDADDPGLHGADPDYLVAAGHAEVVKGSQPASDPEPVEVPGEDVEVPGVEAAEGIIEGTFEDNPEDEDIEPIRYEDQTVDELKEELRERGLPVSGTKDDLILRLVEDNMAHDAGVDED